MVAERIGDGDDDARREFALLVLVNAIPITGLVWFDWEFFVLYLFYWIDIAALIVVYAGCALFAQRTVTTEGRNFTLLWVSSDSGRDERQCEDPWTIEIHPRLPPLYPRNLGLTLVNGFGLLIFAVFFGYAVVDDFVGWEHARSELTSPLVLASLVAVVGSHVGHAYRTYFRSGRYEDVSAHTIFEIPARIILLLAFVVPMWIIVTVLLTAFVQEGVSESISLQFGFVVLVGLWVLIRATIDWGRLRAERLEDPGRLASWFAPEDPRADDR